jgi:hypothetical protein
MKLRDLPLLWIVWVPLANPGALPHPAVAANVVTSVVTLPAADTGRMPTKPTAASTVVAAMARPVRHR